MTAPALTLVRNDDAPFQVLPPLTDAEYDDLRDSIRSRGVLTEIVVDEAGCILDGHHRARIAAELQVSCPRRVQVGLSDAEKVAFAIEANLHRRGSLSSAQKRQVVAASLKAQPEQSDAEHARRVGVSDKTVTSVRAELERGSEIPNLDKRDNPQGRPQPARKPRGGRVTRLTDDERQRIRDLAEQGYSARHIAETLGRAESCIYGVLNPQQSDPANPRSAAALAQRCERARELAGTGHTSRQIAQILGMTFTAFRKWAIEHDIAVPADAVVGRARHIDSNHVVESIVRSLEAIPQSVDLIDFAQLDVAQLQHWTTSLTDSIRALNRFNQKLNKQMKEMVQ